MDPARRPAQHALAAGFQFLLGAGGGWRAGRAWREGRHEGRDLCAGVHRRQAERGTIGSQLEPLRAHVAAAGDELVGEFCDDGHSGARLDRPGLDALRDAAEAGLFEAVWCLSPDRLARSTPTR